MDHVTGIAAAIISGAVAIGVRRDAAISGVDSAEAKGVEAVARSRGIGEAEAEEAIGVIVGRAQAVEGARAVGEKVVDHDATDHRVRPWSGWPSIFDFCRTG